MLKILAGLLFLTAGQFAMADSNIMIIGGSEAANPDLKAGTVGIIMGQRPQDGFCTGTYIGDGKILTAAHCAVGVAAKKESTKVVFVLPDKSQAECKVTDVIANPAFSGSATNPNSKWWEDIGALKTKCDDFDLSTVKPVAMASDTRTNNWDDSIVAGYGTNSSEPGCGGFCQGPPPTFPKLMQTTKGKAYAFEDDPEFVQQYPKFIQGIKDGKLVCFSASNETGSFFLGDSGGPTVEKDLSNGAVQLGVHSVVLVNKDREPIYTCDVAVAPFYNWIKGL